MTSDYMTDIYCKLREITSFINNHKDQLNCKKYQNKETLNEVATQLFVDQIKTNNKNIKTRNYKENFFVDMILSKEQILLILMIFRMCYALNSHRPRRTNFLFCNTLITKGIADVVFASNLELAEALFNVSAFHEGIVVKDSAGTKIVDGTSYNKLMTCFETMRTNRCATLCLPALIDGETYNVTFVLGKTLMKQGALCSTARLFHQGLKTIIENANILTNYEYGIRFLQFIYSFPNFTDDFMSYFKSKDQYDRETAADNFINLYVSEHMFLLTNLFNVCKVLWQHIKYLPRKDILMMAIVTSAAAIGKKKEIITSLLDSEHIDMIAQHVLTMCFDKKSTFSVDYVSTLLNEFC